MCFSLPGFSLSLRTMTLDVAAPASLAQVTIKSATFKIMTKSSSLIILQPLNIPLKTMTGPGPSNCSERVLKVTMFHMLARKKQTKVQLSSFFFVSGSILANHRTSSSRILQSKKVLTLKNYKHIANSKTGFSLFVYFPLKSQCILE